MKQPSNRMVLIVLLDAFADWEAAFLASALRTGTLPGRRGCCDVRYAAPEGRSVRSLGGMTVMPDLGTGTLPEECAAVILVGGMSWRSPEAEHLAPLVDEALRRGLLVAAICNAASFLAAHGYLNTVHHTGNTLEMLREWGGANYTGAALFEERQAVCDGQIITANGTGYLEFTRECLLWLHADTPEAIDASYEFNKRGFYAAAR